MDKEGLRQIIEGSRRSGITSVETYVSIFGDLLQVTYNQRLIAKQIDAAIREAELQRAYHKGFADAMRMFS